MCRPGRRVSHDSPCGRCRVGIPRSPSLWPPTSGLCKRPLEPQARAASMPSLPISLMTVRRALLQFHRGHCGGTHTPTTSTNKHPSMGLPGAGHRIHSCLACRACEQRLDAASCTRRCGASTATCEMVGSSRGSSTSSSLSLMMRLVPSWAHPLRHQGSLCYASRGREPNVQWHPRGPPVMTRRHLLATRGLGFKHVSGCPSSAANT